MVPPQHLLVAGVISWNKGEQGDGSAVPSKALAARHEYACCFMRYLNEFSCSYKHIIIQAGFFPDGKISEHETWKSNVSDAERKIMLRVLIRTA
jgi:hypothetical protein